MKSWEEMRKEAESVLESVGDAVKRLSESAFTDESVNAVASLADSYARLYEEIQK